MSINQPAPKPSPTPTPVVTPTQPSPTPTPTPTNGVKNFVKENTQIVQQHPTIAAAALASNDPNAANTLAATATTAARVKAVQDHIATYNTKSLWQHILGDAVQWEQNVANFLPGANTLANWASKPDKEVQKDYKFLGSVYERHGPVEGLLATLPVIAGAYVGSKLGPEGTVVTIQANEPILYGIKEPDRGCVSSNKITPKRWGLGPFFL